MDAAGKDIEVLRADGVPFEVLTRAGCIAAEPGWRVPLEHAGGLRLPGRWSWRLLQVHQPSGRDAEVAGVTFRWGVSIRHLRAEGGRITAVDTDQGLFTADRYVLALGPHSPQLVRHLGIKLGRSIR